MKFAKIMLAAAVAVGTVFMVTGCGDSTISMVKDGVLELDKTRTIGTVLTLKSSSVKWEKYVKDGQTIVHASCVWKDPAFVDIAKRYPFTAAGLPLPEESVDVYFVIDADGQSFELGYLEFHNKSGETKKQSKNNVDLANMIKKVYNL